MVEVDTLCVHTRDAKKTTEGCYEFQLPLSRLRSDAVKVALASCEFPMVQWTIEKLWNRLYLHERVHIEGGEGQVFAIQTSHERIVAHLPIALNRVTKTFRDGNDLHVHFAHPHGLCLADGRANPELRSVALIGDSRGTVHPAPESLRATSLTALVVKDACASGDDARYLHVTALQSPHALCAWLNAALASLLYEAEEGLRASIAYDAETDRVRLSFSSIGRSTAVRVERTPISLVLGLSDMQHRVAPGSEPVQVSSQETQLWEFVELTPGFYAPCHRPMATGPPLRFGPELETAINRLYFSVGNEQPYRIIFSEPGGAMSSVVVPPGRYSTQSLAAHLERTMTADDPNVHFSVSLTSDDRFVFSCERKDPVSKRVVDAPFSLHWNHPLSLDPSRLGYGPHPLFGSSSYTAPTPVRMPRRNGARAAFSSIVRVHENTPQKRFSLHAVPPPVMVGVIAKLGRHDRVVLQTVVNKRVFAHGFEAGDVVRIVSMSAPARVLVAEDKEVELRPSATRLHMCDVVVEAATAGEGVTELAVILPSRIEPLELQTCVQVVASPAPCSFHFRKAQSIPAHVIGFPARAVQWGVDGSVEDERGMRVGPFEAPYTHDLDHPDYVLMTFSESGSSTFEHSFDGETRSIFCKLSLYPLFREERMLPRDTQLMRGNFGSFRIQFWNPDLRTPYHFHGAEFSLSLSFVTG